MMITKRGLPPIRHQQGSAYVTSRERLMLAAENGNPRTWAKLDATNGHTVRIVRTGPTTRKLLGTTFHG